MEKIETEHSKSELADSAEQIQRAPIASNLIHQFWSSATNENPIKKQRLKLSLIELFTLICDAEPTEPRPPILWLMLAYGSDHERKHHADPVQDAIDEVVSMCGDDELLQLDLEAEWESLMKDEPTENSWPGLNKIRKSISYGFEKLPEYAGFEFLCMFTRLGANKQEGDKRSQFISMMADVTMHMVPVQKWIEKRNTTGDNPFADIYTTDYQLGDRAYAMAIQKELIELILLEESEKCKEFKELCSPELHSRMVDLCMKIPLHGDNPFADIYTSDYQTDDAMAIQQELIALTLLEELDECKEFKELCSPELYAVMVNLSMKTPLFIALNKQQLIINEPDTESYSPRL